MKRLLTALGLLLAAGCATPPQPYAPVRDVAYQAIGAEPFWVLTIGDDRIVLRSSSLEGERSWPRTLPRTENGVRTWVSGENGAAIIVEARPGPCTSESGRVYADNVRVRAAGAELVGCGGRLLSRERR